MQYILLLILLLPALPLISQDQSLDSLAFNSSYEYEIINQSLTDSGNDRLALFAVVDENVDQNDVARFRERWDGLMSSFQTEKFSKKSREKQVRTIYKELHDALLVKYELNNRYPEIFTKGYYNCVSATAMYAMALEELNIPFQIKETPTHVYLVAYPDDENILLESTDPLNGYVTFDTNFQRNYIQNLASAKLISQEELKRRDPDELFEQHFFSNENIDIHALAGIQYANDALLKLENNQLEGALHQLEKAQALYPSDRYRTLIVALAVEILHTRDATDPETAIFYARIGNYSTGEVKLDEMAGEYMRISQALLNSSYQPDVLAKWVKYQESNLKWPELLTRINFLYLYETGRIAYNRNDFKTAIQNFGEAMRSEPENTDVQNALISSIDQRLTTLGSNKQEIDTLLNYQKQFAELESNLTFKSMLAWRYLRQFAMSYDLNNPAEAETYRTPFEEMMSSDLLVDRNDIGRAYSIAAVYYFKRGNSRKARELINKGLELAPDNYELLLRKKAIR